MLISEELLLLIGDPNGRWRAASDAVPLALAGGLLAELAARERVTVDDRGRIAVISTASVGDDVLDEALATFAKKAGKKPKDVLGAAAKGLGDRLYARLAAAGVVAIQDRGFLRSKRFPVLDPAPRDHAYADAAAVLLGRANPDPRTGTLLGLLVAVDAVAAVFDPQELGMSKADLKRRAKELTSGDWAVGAAGKAVRDAQAAVTAAVITAVVATTVSTS